MRSIVSFLFLCLILYLFSQLLVAQPTNLLALHVLDVGQGDSLYLRLPSQDDIVVDAGPDDRVLAALGPLMPLGDREIELLIISHNHSDHLGGAVNLLDRYKVKQVWLSGAIHTTDTYRQFLEKIKEQQIPTQVVKAGDTVNFGETQLLVLFPPTSMTGQLPDDQHDATVVVKIAYQQFCALLTGDLNTNQANHEATIIEIAHRLNQSLGCQALKVTHHGSGSGSTAAWLDEVKPQVALISAGAGNAYGHPAAPTLQRLKDRGIEIFRTDLQGTLSLTSNGTDFWTKTSK